MESGFGIPGLSYISWYPAGISLFWCGATSDSVGISVGSDVGAEVDVGVGAAVGVMLPRDCGIVRGVQI